MYTRVQGKVGTLVQGGKGMGEHNTDQLSAGGVGGGHASPHSRWSGLGWRQFKIQQVSVFWGIRGVLIILVIFHIGVYGVGFVSYYYGG